jgi:2-dehydropantoate 2-reductase
MRVAVLGSGRVGGYYRALLAKGGHDVAVIARGAHLEARRRRGLTVRTPEGESTIPVTAVADTRTVGAVDLVLFGVKSDDTEPAAQALAPLMARDTAAVTFQNGVDNVEAIAAVVGSGALLVGAMNAGAVASGAWFGPIVRPRPRVLAREGDPRK